MNRNKLPANFRFSPENIRLLKALSEHLSLSKTATMEMALKKLAYKERIVLGKDDRWWIQQIS
jgi:hypothetical protein